MGVPASAEVSSHRNLHTGLPSYGSSDLSQTCNHYCSIGITMRPKIITDRKIFGELISGYRYRFLGFEN